MIWESHYWKRDLLKYAAMLRKKMAQKKWREESEVIVERTVFIGFYSIRKLMEAKKLSTRFESLNIPVTLYPSRGKNVTLLNWHRTDQLFDMESPRKSSLSVAGLSNQVIHSYVFQAVVDQKGGLSAFLVASDRQRGAGLFQVSIGEVVKLFEAIGADYPAQGSRHFDPKRGDYVVFHK